jgi:predicted lipase
VIDVFRGKKLRDLAAMNISLQDIDTYNPYIKEITEDINKKRDASIEFLKKNKNEALDHIKAQVEDELGGGLFNSITKAIPYANLLAMFGVGDETQLKNKIFAQ